MKLNPEIGMAMFQSVANAKKVSEKTDSLCPDCGDGHFLHLTEKSVVHLDPPRKRVKCLNCEYRGFVPVELDETLSVDITDTCVIKRSSDE